MPTHIESKSKYKNIYERIIDMPEMTVISIEHTCPHVNQFDKCDLALSIGSANTHGWFRARHFHVGNDLYVVKIATD